MRSLLTLAVLLSATCGIFAQSKSDKVVKINATATKPDEQGKQTVTITIDIDKPWHLYANPVSNDDLAEAATKIKFLKIEGEPKIIYPAGKLVKDATVGDYKVYEGKVTIKADVKRAKGETGPLEFNLTLQACDDKSCLAKVTVKKSVP